uniref:Reverse transcriptase Ty1/copia-type domain-containing protein n=1 Tax=Solanum lycopersicum TaxID=4081 RepID=A0A3Q7EGE5_SOLLC
MGSCGPVSTPTSSSSKLSNTGGCPFHDQTLYRSTVGALQYLMFTRPNIASVNLMVYFFHGSSTLLHGYSDSDWVGDIDDRNSTTGFTIFLGSHLISWASRKQRAVSRSSTEAKYRALAAATSEMTWIEHLIREIGCYTTSFPILWYDNLSATYLTSNPIFHFRTKHMDTNFHFVHDKGSVLGIVLGYISCLFIMFFMCEMGVQCDVHFDEA